MNFVDQLPLAHSIIMGIELRALEVLDLAPKLPLAHPVVLVLDGIDRNGSGHPLCWIRIHQGLDTEILADTRQAIQSRNE